MKRLFALFLAFSLIFCLCACNESPSDPVKGTWYIDLSPDEFVLIYAQQLNELLGIGDIANLTGKLPALQDLTFLLVLDGHGLATAYTEKVPLQTFFYELFDSLLSEQMLYQLFGSQAQAEAAMGDLSIDELLYILQTQFAGIDFTGDFASLCGYTLSEEYLVIPITDGYTYENGQVLIRDGFLEYDETDLLLTDTSKLTALGLALTDRPFIFRRISDKTEY